MFDGLLTSLVQHLSFFLGTSVYFSICCPFGITVRVQFLSTGNNHKLSHFNNSHPNKIDLRGFKSETFLAQSS